MQQRPLTSDAYVSGILSGNRVVLSRAITLIESTHEDHWHTARDVIRKCMPHAGNAFRIGVTGAPGVGKSTFIDALGLHLIEAGKRVAVLAVDPSSSKTGGSILGDKTRMTRLGQLEEAYIRPSPNSGMPGGIAGRTREAMLLCEAAGFDVVFVETVGVGQSEFSVHELVDMLILLLITGAGDDLQGIKRGIMEMADLIVINKSDGANAPAARQLLQSIRMAVHALPAPRPEWETRVLAASSIEDTGMTEIGEVMAAFQKTMRDASAFEANRSRQAVAWMRRHVEEGLMRRLTEDARIEQRMAELESEVAKGTCNPMDAAEEVLALLRVSGAGPKS